MGSLILQLMLSRGILADMGFGMVLEEDLLHLGLVLSEGGEHFTQNSVAGLGEEPLLELPILG